ncbi:MAG: ABC transporter permease [Acidimicrobiaceae bacterium]|nr:ABC transporter permease [Acidimicrobiaceae bacterium]MBO0746998.1 ABC transporter permease [Acidimicrobiaceae bacterium]
MKALTDTRLLFNRYGLQMVRNPVWVFVGLSTPLLYLVLFTPLLNSVSGRSASSGFSASGRAIDGFLPGILALLAFASGSGPGFNTIFELQAGVIERFRVTPASRTAILLGPIFFATVAMFVFDIALVAVGAAFGFHIHLGGLLILAVLLGLLMIMTAAFSIATAVATGDISGFAAIINGMNLPVLLLGGVLLPISLGPTWLRVLAHFDPLYYLVEAARALSAGNLATTATWQAFAVLTPLTILTVAWATNVFRRAVA